MTAPYFNTLHHRVQFHIDLKRYEDALKEADLSLAQSPCDARLSQQKAWALMMLKRYDEGLVAARDAVKEAPNWAWAWCMLGLLLTHTRKKEPDIRNAFQRALSLDPNEPAIHSNWAWFLLQAPSLGGKERITKAMEAYREGLKLHPDFLPLTLGLSELLISSGTLDEAESLARNALEQEPESARAHTALGNIFDMRAKPRQAMDEFRESLRINPTDAYVAVGLDRLKNLAELQELQASSHYSTPSRPFTATPRIIPDKKPWKGSTLLYVCIGVFAFRGCIAAFDSPARTQPYTAPSANNLRQFHVPPPAMPAFDVNSLVIADAEKNRTLFDDVWKREQARRRRELIEAIPQYNIFADTYYRESLLDHQLRTTGSDEESDQAQMDAEQSSPADRIRDHLEMPPLIGSHEKNADEGISSFIGIEGKDFTAPEANSESR